MNTCCSKGLLRSVPNALVVLISDVMLLFTDLTDCCFSQDERKKRLGPGGLDPVEVFESLPKVIQITHKTFLALHVHTRLYNY